MAINTGAYSVMISAEGTLASVKAGDVEFLGRHEKWKTGSAVLDHIKGGNFGVFHDELTRMPLGKPKIAGHSVVAGDEGREVKYVFRENEFDIFPFLKRGLSRGGAYLLMASPDVVKSLDGVTNYQLSMRGQVVIGLQQEGMRWVSRQGAVLGLSERLDGYPSFYWWGTWPNKDGMRGVTFGLRPSRPRITLRPMANPPPVEALQFVVKGPNENFLLPGTGKTSFNINAVNLTAGEVKATVSFEVRDYLTREIVGQKKTNLELDGHASALLPSEVPLKEPGPFRGAIVIREGGRSLKEYEWIFTYDFPSYRPELTRQPDFKAFWKEAIKEVRAVPMDARMKLREDKSNARAEVYEVSLASLGERRIWGYYSRPKNLEQGKKYPVVYFCPPTGVYPMNLWAGDGGGTHCTFNIAVHGFDLRLSDMPQGPHPWKGYITHGIESKETFSWRWIYASMVRCMDFLASRPEVDPKRIGITGSSQGGGLAIVLAGLDPRAAFLFPRFSGLARLDWTVKYETGYWPFKMNAKPKNQSEDQFLKMLSYFDAMNFAPDIKCPAVAHIGMLDWVTASGNQIAAFAQLKPGQVELLCDAWDGHGSQSRRVRALIADRKNRFLRGEPPIVKPSK
ncbi:MAG: acetylxylan esterase [Planctomycetota bacterium]|nr:acetylxylan esterase [Planctomycetota bacterium]MDP7248092.1 acetylxylan esterase [Planctomycetota bacterium]